MEPRNFEVECAFWGVWEETERYISRGGKVRGKRREENETEGKRMKSKSSVLIRVTERDKYEKKWNECVAQLKFKLSIVKITIPHRNTYDLPKTLPQISTQLHLTFMFSNAIECNSLFTSISHFSNHWQIDKLAKNIELKTLGAKKAITGGQHVASSQCCG